MVIMTLVIGCLFAIPITANATTDSSRPEENPALDEFSAIIMSINNTADKEKIIDYFCEPAYEKSKIIDVSEGEQSESLNDSQKDAQLLNEARQLSILSGETLDKKIAEFAENNASEIIESKDIAVTKEYVAYAQNNFNREIVKALEKKPLVFEENASVITDYTAIEPLSDAAATKTNKKQMYKEYGSKSGGAYCKFWTTVTWKTSGGKITSISSTTPKPTTPAYITPTAAHRNKTYTSSTKKTGYVQKAWGYVNLLYGDGKITGYYIIDGKVFGSNTNRYKGDTLSPALYKNYKWGSV